MKNNIKRETIISIITEALMTIAATPAILTMLLIGSQSIIAPNHFAFTPSSRILTQQDNPVWLNKYMYVVAESTTTEPVEIFFILLAAICLFKLTEQSANNSYFRLFIFMSKVIKTPQK